MEACCANGRQTSPRSAGQLLPSRSRNSYWSCDKGWLSQERNIGLCPVCPAGILSADPFFLRLLADKIPLGAQAKSLCSRRPFRYLRVSAAGFLDSARNDRLPPT